jgi:hypothetical protein
MDTKLWVTDFFYRFEPHMSHFDQCMCRSLLQTDYSWGTILDSVLSTANSHGLLSEQDARTAVNILLNEPTSDYHRYIPAWQGLIDEVTTKQAA